MELAPGEYKGVQIHPNYLFVHAPLGESRKALMFVAVADRDETDRYHTPTPSDVKPKDV